MIKHDHDFYMRIAIDVAREGRSVFGAVLVDEEGGQISAFNTTKLDGPSAHAEMNVLKLITELDYDRAEDLILYSTVEPCPMCMGAVLWHRIGTVVYGVSIDEAAQHIPQIKISSRTIADAASFHILIHGGVEHDKVLDLLVNR